MPLPILPFDIISVIISHLRNSSTAAQISEGKAISLVCKAWMPLGQALCWRNVDVQPRQIPPLLDHLNGYPELGKLVRKLNVCEKPDSTDSDNDSHEEEEAKPDFSQLPSLLLQLSRLEGFDIEGDLGKSWSLTVETLSKLPVLTHCNLGTIVGRADWWDGMATSLQNGFNKLTALVFGAPVTIVSSLPEENPPARKKKIPLKWLIAGWTAASDVGPQLANRFLSHLDPATLRDVTLMESAACIETIRWLMDCPNLINLSVTLSLDQLPLDLPKVFNLLPQFITLKTFEVGLAGTDMLIGSPVSLPTIFAAFSPSLRIFQAPQFVFLDFDTLAFRALPSSADENTRLVLALCPCPHDDGRGGGGGPDEEGRATEMIVWGEEFEGVMRWFYDTAPGDKDSE
jgi:hypothetical protein